MKTTEHNRLLPRLEALAFYLLLLVIIGLLGWLSLRYDQTWDWSKSGRNSLDPVSAEILKRLEEPLKITSYAPDNPALRDQISAVIDRYRRSSDKIEFSFINPTMQPEQARSLGIQVSGELVLEYQGRIEKLRDLDEESISNSIQRLAHQGERWLAAVSGHGERSFDDQANHDLGEFGSELLSKGLRVQSLNLTQGLQVPDNTSVLILAGPQTPLLSGEVTLVLDYIERGGNLLWLTDPASNPEQADNLQPLSERLDISLLPGTIVDASAASLGLDNPAYAIVPQYPQHPTTAGFNLLTLYPYATALQTRESRDWKQTPILTTLERAWNETGEIRGEVQRDMELGEMAGPLTIGVALEREVNGKEQRILVIGDGDFLSNAFLGNGGNLDLGINLIRWLSSDDTLLNIPARTAQDTRLELSPVMGALIGIGFLLVLPILFLGAGVVIWFRRRNS